MRLRHIGFKKPEITANFGVNSITLLPKNGGLGIMIKVKARLYFTLLYYTYRSIIAVIILLTLLADTILFLLYLISTKNDIRSDIWIIYFYDDILPLQ